MALTDGAAHAVDSSELAFKLACVYAFREAYKQASPVIMEPIMAVEVGWLSWRHFCCSANSGVLDAIMAGKGSNGCCVLNFVYQLPAHHGCGAHHHCEEDSVVHWQQRARSSSACTLPVLL